MNPNNLTIKAQEALQQAQQLAFNASNQSIESGHILKALIDDNGDVIDFLLKKNDVNMSFLQQKLDNQLKSYPRIYGEGGQLMSRDANNVLLRAGAVIKEFKDEYVSVEHLLLAILQGKDNTANLLKDGGLTVKGLKSRSEEHTSELQSRGHLVCRLLLEKKNHVKN